MKFGLLVSEGPYTHQASDSAYQFVVAALAKGHEIQRVFFYHDGVNNATRLTEPPQDDRHVVNRWSAIAAEHKVVLRPPCAAESRKKSWHRGFASRVWANWWTAASRRIA